MFGLFLVLAQTCFWIRKRENNASNAPLSFGKNKKDTTKLQRINILVLANAKSCRTRRLRSNDIEHVINSLRLNEPSQYRVICKRVPRNEERNFSRVRVSWNLLFPVLENERKIGQIRYTAFCWYLVFYGWWASNRSFFDFKVESSRLPAGE